LASAVTEITDSQWNTKSNQRAEVACLHLASKTTLGTIPSN